MAAARRKGRFIGGRPALGYDVDKETHSLKINSSEAELIRHIFDLYIQKQSLLKVTDVVNTEGYRTKQYKAQSGKVFGGKSFKNTGIQWIIKNILYTGKILYKNEIYNGLHAPIISEEIFNKVQAILKENGRLRSSPTNVKQTGLLSQLLYCHPCGKRMFYTYARKKTRHYKYYICQTATKNGYKHCQTKMIAAHLIEKPIIDALNITKWDSLLFEEQRQIIKERINKVEVDRQGETLMANFTDGTKERIQMQTINQNNNPKKEFAKLPVLKQQLLLAHQIQSFLDNGKAANLREISEWTGLSHSRVCQVMNFLNLCLRIQEEIILGDNPIIHKIPEYKTRPICKESDPKKQLIMWQQFTS